MFYKSRLKSKQDPDLIIEKFSRRSTVCPDPR